MPRLPTFERDEAASSALESADLENVGACWMMVLLTAYLKGGWLLGPVLVSLIRALRIEFCGEEEGRV